MQRRVESPSTKGRKLVLLFQGLSLAFLLNKSTFTTLEAAPRPRVTHWQNALSVFRRQSVNPAVCLTHPTLSLIQWMLMPTEERVDRQTDSAVSGLMSDQRPWMAWVASEASSSAGWGRRRLRGCQVPQNIEYKFLVKGWWRFYTQYWMAVTNTTKRYKAHHHGTGLPLE